MSGRDRWYSRFWVVLVTWLGVVRRLGAVDIQEADARWVRRGTLQSEEERGTKIGANRAEFFGGGAVSEPDVSRRRLAENRRVLQQAPGREPGGNKTEANMGSEAASGAQQGVFGQERCLMQLIYKSTVTRGNGAFYVSSFAFGDVGPEVNVTSWKLGVTLAGGNMVRDQVCVIVRDAEGG